jgi:nonsense-mediated mRNA decay protein 3
MSGSEGGGSEFCVLCGAEERLYNSVCRRCFLDKNSLVELPQVISLSVCSHCEAVEVGKHWENLDIQEAAARDIQRNCRVMRGARCIRVTLSTHIEGQQVEVSTQAEGEFEDIIQPSSGQVTVKITPRTCDRCSRMHGNYFEAIIQLRVDGRDFSEEELSELQGAITHYMEVGGRKASGAFISKVEAVRGGLDFYISNNMTAKSITQEMAARYGAKVSGSPKLAGQKDGRDIYRITYLLRFPRTKRGDIIQIGKHPHLVKGIGRNKVTCIDLRNGTGSKHDLAEIEGTRLMADVSQAMEAVVVSDGFDEVQVMEPVDYKTITVKKLERGELGDKVKIITINGEYFLLPWTQ